MMLIILDQEEATVAEIALLTCTHWAGGSIKTLVWQNSFGWNLSGSCLGCLVALPALHAPH